MTASVSRIAAVPNWLAMAAYASLVAAASTRLVSTALRWAAALTGATVAYVLVMLAFAALWQRDDAHGAIYCAGGMAVAVSCGAWVCAAILLPRHRRAGVWVCIALGTLYPVMLAAMSRVGAPVRTMQYLYIVMSAFGGVAALGTLPLERDGPIPPTVPASPFGAGGDASDIRNAEISTTAPSSR